ncbi:DUF2065 domain-containing protein [Comamonas sp. Y33R10-2]|uniref:DUF2065 family protein n=1 Tax=Comamonas sp. Y33R10-2 TaxID=2853257 RepID=UPI001C5CA73A|nr:DUF2065 family protein [Comamonas sp. Y33R10-2]QXZ08327.1 DUF2065 domain-containing protein [Comamonas sp. Y33R10-2]
MDWWASLGMAMGMVLVLEGLLPLLAPKQWRQMFMQLMQLKDGQLRFYGLLCIAAGFITLALL